MSKQYPLNPVTYYDDLRHMLKASSTLYGQKNAATVYSRQGQESTHSFVQLKEDAEAFAKALAINELTGRHIAIVGENSYEWVVAYFGIVISGGVAVCIDIEQSEDAISEMILESDAISIVTSETLADICQKTKDEHSKIKSVIVIGQEDDGGFESFLQQGRKTSIDYTLGGPIDCKQPAAIVFTSGTTGRAKPVLLSHKALLTNAGDALAMISVDKPYMFAMLPFYHTYGFTCTVLTSLIAGFNFCINGDLKTMVRDMERFKPEIIIAVPLVVEALHRFVWSAIERAGQKKKVHFFMKLGKLVGNPSLFLKRSMQEKFKGTCLERIKTIVSGGAYLDRRVAEDLHAFGIVVLQGYGITECGPLVSVNRNKSFDPGSVGFVVPHYEVRIKEEEILVRGDALMNGYYKDPELTAQYFDDGWFKTGDIGHMDKHGHLFIEGRKKNLIVMKNGKKISPEEIEAAIRISPLVKEVMAYGANSGASVDDVKLAIMVYPDAEATKGMTSYDILEQLQRHVDTFNTKLPAYKQIQMINIREQDFSRTATQKVRRDAI